MFYNDALWIASVPGNEPMPICLEPSMANRHGFITGATGTGKTTTLKVMAESFSALGVPVFMQDVKGDLSGVCNPGEQNDKVERRLDELGVPEWEYTGFPTRFWDIFGDQGHPIRVTVSDMGPSLIARLLNLTDVQTGVLNLVFHIADEQGLLLLDLKDLRAMLSYCAEHRTEFTTDYGNMSPQSIGAIQRSLLTLEEQGGDVFFGEPGLNITDFIMNDEDGRGFINILNAKELVKSPLLYSTFLLWMLSELFEKMPEEGDAAVPKMVFFFDEAHLLFDDAPKAFLDKVVQTVKLIRSKGIGIYFISQSPADIPDAVLAQLQNRVQHALHAYTPAEQKAVRIAAETFRPNPDFSTEEEISMLGVGEALISFLDENGVPAVVEKGKILPPQSFMGPVSDEIINEVISTSTTMEDLYRESYDRESAYEILTAKRQEEEAQKQYEEEQKELEKLRKEQEKAEKAAQREAAAALRKAEQEAAAREREQRRQEAAMIRELSRAVAPPPAPSRRSTTSSRSYTGYGYDGNGSRSTGRSSSGRRSGSYNSRGYSRDDDRMTPPPRPDDDLFSGIGRELGRSITRGIFGTRR